MSTVGIDGQMFLHQGISSHIAERATMRFQLFMN